MRIRLLLFLLLAGTLSLIQAAPILAPGDTVVGGQSDGTNFNVGVIGETDALNNWPAAKSPDQTVDGVGQKYLNFAKLNTGIAVTPTSGSSIAKSLTLWTANDASERDPASYELYGKNSALGAGPFALADFTLISSGALALPSTRNDNGANPLLSNSSQTVTFASNTTAYTSYLVVFPTVKDDGLADSMQIGEIQLNSSNDDFINADTIVGGSGTVAGDIINATTEAGEGNHAGLFPLTSVWYRWTAPANGEVTFDTFGAGTTDTLLAAYTGPSVDALTEVASNVDAPAGGTTQSEITFTAVAGTTYHIVVDLGFTGSAGPFTLNWLDASPAAPSNDDFANGQILSGGTGAVVGTNLLATSEVGEPDHAGDSLGQSVWYRWTAPGSGNVTFDTFTSPTDTVLAAYTGATVDALTEIASNDNAGGGDQSQIMFAAVGGTTYHIAVDSRSGTGPGDITLNWSLLIPAPSNDDFADGEVLSGPTGTVAGSNVGATGEAGEPDHDGSGLGQSVWYRWTAPASGDFAFDTFTSNFDTILAAYTGATVDALTRIASNDQAGGGDQSEITFAAVGGTTYHIAVDSWSGAGPGDITLNWQLAPPSNDNFSSGETITGRTGTVGGDVIGATAEASEPSHAGSPALSSVWYRWTAPGSGNVTFDTFGSGTTETRLAAYTGASVDTLTEIASNDDAAAGDQSEITFVAVGGTTYRIAVDVGAGGGPNDAFTLNWLGTLVPANDNFANGESIGGETGSVAGYNELATMEASEPDHAETGLGQSVWYQWTATGTGVITFDTFSSSFDTVLAAYTGASVDALTTIASNDQAGGGNQSEITFAAVGGTTYLIAVDSRFGDSPGDITLNWSLVDPTEDSINTGFFVQSGSPFSLETNGSTFDTEIGLFDSTGMLIDNDDNGGTGGQSPLDLPSGLSAGTYYLALGGFNTSFANGFAAFGGNAFGDWLLSLPGSGTRSGTQEANEVTWLRFTVFDPPAGAINLGPLANSGEAFSIDSNGSIIDTELGLFNAFGSRLANDDDGGTDSASLIDLTAGLTAGTYYVALGEFNTNFGDGFAVAGGNAAGDWTLNVPTGTQNGTLVEEEIVWFVFTITDPQPGAIDLGLVAAKNIPFTINTFGSSFNTDIGLFDAVGNLMDENDDAADLQSEILLPTGLPEGTYYVALGGSNTSFAIDFVATGGAAFGDWLLNVPGRTTRSGTQGAGAVTWFKFRVSTAPFEITSPGIFLGNFECRLGTDLGRIYAIEALQNDTWLEQERFPGTGSSIFYGFPRMDVPAELFRARDITP